MNKRKLNQNLRTRILPIIETYALKDCKVRVIRARQNYGRYTSVDIRISASVRSSQDNWLPLHFYGPRHIRGFIRNQEQITQTINEWTKLWGLPNDSCITLKNIELVSSPTKV